MILSTLAQLGAGNYETVLVSGELYDSHSCGPGCSHDHDHGGFIEDEFDDEYDLETILMTICWMKTLSKHRIFRKSNKPAFF